MRITVHDADQCHGLKNVQPGEELVLRLFVESVAVESIDVSRFGEISSERVKGETTLTLVYVETLERTANPA